MAVCTGCTRELVSEVAAYTEKQNKGKPPNYEVSGGAQRFNPLDARRLLECPLGPKPYRVG